MPKFQVNAMLTISVITDVEADSREEAKEIALARSVIGLCHQCSGTRTVDEEWCTNGELDGTPFDLSTEEA